MSRVTAAPGRLLLGLSYLGFISLGLPDGLLGVGWPSMRADFGVRLESVGLLLGVGTVGYVSSSVMAGFLITRIGVGWLLAVSTGLVGAGLTGFAMAPVFAVVVACALLTGLGSGAIDAGLNVYAAAHFGARHMNWLHAAFGFGATVGPLVMTAALSSQLSWRWGYGTVALVQALLATAFAVTAGTWAGAAQVHRQDPPADPVRTPAQRPAATGATAATTGPATGATGPGTGATGPGTGVTTGPATGAPGAVPAAPASVTARATLAMPVVWLGVLTFAVYTAMEITAGLWAYTLLTEARGLSAAVAGVIVSAYWGSLFVGRLLYGVVANRLAPGPVLITCMVGMAVGAVMLTVPAGGWLAVLGLAMIGGFAAPVFPLLTLTTAQRVGAEHAGQAVGLQVGAAGLGGVAIPAGVGVLISRYGPDALAPALIVLGFALIALHLGTLRTART